MTTFKSETRQRKWERDRARWAGDLEYQERQRSRNRLLKLKAHFKGKE